SNVMGDIGGVLGQWQTQIWVLMILTVIYAVLFYGKTFPTPKLEGMTSLSQNLKAMLGPTFLFLFVAMALTAISQFGPNQWVSVILPHGGTRAMLILDLTSGSMAVARYFPGPVVNLFRQPGILLGLSIFTTIGISLFSVVTCPIAYLGAVIFALYFGYFWPT